MTRITAAALRGLIPAAVIKATDQTLTSNATLQNDSALQLPVAAGAAYLFRCYLDYEGDSGGYGDIQWTWAVPSGATLRYAADGGNSSGAALYNKTYTETSVPIGYAKGAGTLCSVKMDGTLLTGGTAGTLQLQWAQYLSDTTPAIVHAQSCLILEQIS